MGFALCALFDAFFPLKDFISASVDKTFGLRAHVIALGGDMPHRHYSSDIFFRLTSGVCHIWLLYLSRDSWFATLLGMVNATRLRLHLKTMAHV